MSNEVNKLRAYIRGLLLEVPLDDFEYVKKDVEEDVMVREEVANYFKAIPQSVNIYVAHTDDLSWAHRLPNEIQGKVSGFKSRGQVTLTDISNVGKLYPQIQRAMNPNGINLLYVYPKSFEVPAGGDTFIADVNPHYLAHDLHHMLENAPGRERGEKDKFTSLIKEYLMELVWLSHGGGSMEAEQVRNTMRLSGRRLGVANTNLLMSELFPGIKLPSGDFDLFGDVFADYLKNDGNLVLGVPEQLDYKGTVIELNPDSKHDQRAQQYEKKFKDLFDTVLDPLKGKVAMFNIFEVEHREVERARKQAEEKMQADHGQLIDHIKDMGGEFKYFDESYKEEGVEELIFDTGLKPEKPVMKVDDFVQQFPKEAERIESLGYKITSAFDGFGTNSVEIRLQNVTTNETILRGYIRSLLLEDESRRKQLAKDLGVAGTKENNPTPSVYATDEEHIELVKQARSQGRDLKKAFAKSADRAFLDSLVTVHWFRDPQTMKQFLDGSFSAKDELSASAYLPGEVKGAGKFGDYGILIKGYITLLANDMDQLYTGGTLAYEEVFPDMKKQSGINKGVQSTYDPEAYEEYKILVLDEEDWDPSFGGFRGTQNNEALVDNWTPMALIVPDGPLTRLPPEWHPGSERTEPKVPDTTEAEEWEDLAKEAGLDIQVITHKEFTSRGWV